MDSKDQDLIVDAVKCLGHSLVNCYVFFRLKKENELTDKKKSSAALLSIHMFIFWMYCTSYV